jgi:C_GCAxxG_C_C family probable redox protein
MLRNIKESSHAILAMKYFKEGYNCAQAVLLSFSDMYELDRETAAKIASGFGGGMGRLREVCGATTGMFMVIGLIHGYDDPTAREEKTQVYKMVQELARDMEESNGSIVCRELLGLAKKKESPQASERTEAYYKKRPCVEIVGQAAALLEEYLHDFETQS